MSPRRSTTLAIAVMLAVSTSCRESSSPDGGPTPDDPARPAPAAPPGTGGTGADTVSTAPAFPAPGRPGAIYMGPANLYDDYVTYHGAPLASRFVLFPDGTFVLQLSSLRYGLLQYPGRYTRDGANVTFAFDDANRAGAWSATATLDAARLTVRYNSVMSLADFVDGTYVRTTSVAP